MALECVRLEDVVVAQVVVRDDRPEPEDGDREAEVADPVDQERLHRRRGGRRLAMPEARPAGSCKRRRLPRRRTSAGSCWRGPGPSSRRRTGRSGRRTGDSPGRLPCSRPRRWRPGPRRKSPSRASSCSGRRRGSRSGPGDRWPSASSSRSTSESGPAETSVPSENRNARPIPATTGMWAVDLQPTAPRPRSPTPPAAGRVGSTRRIARRNRGHSWACSFSLSVQCSVFSYPLSLLIPRATSDSCSVILRTG